MSAIQNLINYWSDSISHWSERAQENKKAMGTTFNLYSGVDAQVELENAMKMLEKAEADAVEFAARQVCEF